MTQNKLLYMFLLSVLMTSPVSDIPAKTNSIISFQF